MNILTDHINILKVQKQKFNNDNVKIVMNEDVKIDEMVPLGNEMTVHKRKSEFKFSDFISAFIITRK